MSELPSGTVTLLFTDVEGSTRLIRELRDRWADAHSAVRRILREALAEHAGREVDAQGDALLAAFGRARDAVGAAAQAQRRLHAHSWPDGAAVRVRMGIHTGEPSVGDEGYLGLDVVRGARLCSIAHGGQVLLSNATRALLDEDDLPGIGIVDLGQHELKDLPQPMRVHQLEVQGLPGRFDPLPTAVDAGAEAPLAAIARADELAAELESVTHGLGAAIERDVLEQLRRGGIPTGAPSRPERRSRFSPMLLAAAGVLVAIAYLIVRVLA